MILNSTSQSSYRMLNYDLINSTSTLHALSKVKKCCKDTKMVQISK